ncbi:MAG: hypothetical protein Q8M29_11065 [Bacteroidota bacterium]|nr:hypothetical protein [Bacteroidota bacterium]
MQKHLGNILENAVRKSEYPISKLARQIGYTRQHMYNLFQQPNVDIALLEEIGKIIRHDFSDEVKVLKKYGKHASGEPVGEFSVEYGTLEKKYIDLLEKYSKLQTEYAELLKNTGK